MGIWDKFFERAKKLLGNEEVVEQKKRCYYELLEVDKDATEDEIKRSYKKLALKWHPDKNPDRLDECAAYFVILKQAYEVLCDPQERAFYDRHRENIIYGGEGAEETKDTGLKLDKFFERSCFQGFGDDETGFYTVYRELFHKLAAEEYAYIEDLDERNFPVFGKSTSDYESLVDPFYGFWMDFSTNRSFAWVDKYNMRDAHDRPTARAMEKENKKFRDAAKKIRSEEIQKLVMHIRKLDKRVKQNREKLELKKKQQLQRAAEQQKLDIRRNLENIGEYEISEEAQTEHRRDLEDIEKLLDAEFGTLEDDGDKESVDNLDGENTSECIVCQKFFKSMKAFNNHQKSRKHRLMVDTLRKHMKEDDKLLFAETNDWEDDSLANPQVTVSKKRKKKKAQKAVEEDQRSEALAQSIEELKIADVEEQHIIQASDITCEAAARSDKAKRRNQTKSKGVECKVGVKGKDAGPTVPVPSTCQMCSETFESKSKLHNHLKETGHATVKSSVDYAEKGAKKKEAKKAKNKKQLKSEEF